jgi:hypothetical protein
MHRALRIVEIIGIIAQYTKVERDLVALLCVCKFFEEPVRVILWRYIPHANALARLISGSQHMTVTPKEGSLLEIKAYNTVSKIYHII